MDGLAFVQMVEIELKKRGIPKERFYRESGISSATMSQWRKGIYSPSSAAIRKIEDYLGLVFCLEQKESTTTPASSEQPKQHINVIRIAGRDGSFRERRLTDAQLAALNSLLDQLPDASDDL